MALTKIQFLGYKDNKFSSKNGKFVAMVNPEKYDKKFSINYNNVKNAGGTNESPKFNYTASQKLTIELNLDDTGAVPRNGENKGKSVDTMIKDLKKVMYDYNSDTHEPNFVQIVWGSLLFNCRLQSIDINFTLFKPSGEPLRAKVILNFQEYVDPAKEASVKNANSPDLTHIITVKEGETLPGLCQKVYGDSSYYLGVAKENGLMNFRNLKGGSTIYFPPIT
ncbi:MAG: LysM repeat protein [Flavobacteriales bacterium]|jgi:LysM repeat protein